jgi:hypothetical protein
VLQALQELGVIRVSHGGRRRGAPSADRPPLLASFDLAGVAEVIKSGKAKNIIVMVRLLLLGLTIMKQPVVGVQHMCRLPVSSRHLANTQPNPPAPGSAAPA